MIGISNNSSVDAHVYPFALSESAERAAREMFSDYPDLLTTADVASLTGLSVQTIRNEINNGHLPGCRIGRKLYVPKQALIEYILKGGGING